MKPLTFDLMVAAIFAICVLVLFMPDTPPPISVELVTMVPHE